METDKLHGDDITLLNPSNKTQTHKISIYLPPFQYLLAKAIADKNEEPLAALVKRLLLPQIEEAASASFRASNALHSAVKNNELSAGLATEIVDYLTAHLSKSSEEASETEE